MTQPTAPTAPTYDDGMAHRPIRLAVCGAAESNPGLTAAAMLLGRAIARSGAALICGGLGGVMEAAARGAHGAGGITIGVLPGNDASAANSWITLPLPTGLGEARNALVVRFADAVIAVGGGWGTLSEIALARKMNVPVVLLGTSPAAGMGIESASNADDAVRRALALAARERE